MLDSLDGLSLNIFVTYLVFVPSRFYLRQSSRRMIDKVSRTAEVPTCEFGDIIRWWRINHDCMMMKDVCAEDRIEAAWRCLSRLVDDAYHVKHIIESYTDDELNTISTEKARLKMWMSLNVGDWNVNERVSNIGVTPNLGLAFYNDYCDEYFWLGDTSRRDSSCLSSLVKGNGS
jgi:hypothetical protein